MSLEIFFRIQKSFFLKKKIGFNKKKFHTKAEVGGSVALGRLNNSVSAYLQNIEKFLQKLVFF